MGKSGSKIVIGETKECMEDNIKLYLKYVGWRSLGWSAEDEPVEALHGDRKFMNFLILQLHRFYWIA